jgi:hypothetical protein
MTRNEKAIVDGRGFRPLQRRPHDSLSDKLIYNDKNQRIRQLASIDASAASLPVYSPPPCCEMETIRSQ